MNEPTVTERLTQLLWQKAQDLLDEQRSRAARQHDLDRAVKQLTDLANELNALGLKLCQSYSPFTLHCVVEGDALWVNTHPALSFRVGFDNGDNVIFTTKCDGEGDVCFTSFARLVDWLLPVLARYAVVEAPQA